MGRLDLRGPPGKINLRLYVLRFQISLRVSHELGGDPFSLQIPDALYLGINRNGYHPLDGPEALFCIIQLRDLFNVGGLLHDPVISRKAAVKDAAFDVARHLLSTYEHGFYLCIVKYRIICPRTYRDVIPCFAEKLKS